MAPYWRRGPRGRNNGSDDNDEVSNPNPRYKGRRYDPNYHANRNNLTIQEYLLQQRGRTDQRGRKGQRGRQGQRGAHSSNLNNLASPSQQPNTQAQWAQQQQPFQQQPFQQQQPQSLDIASFHALQFLVEAGQQIQQYLLKDADGDIRMCTCSNAGGLQCYHGIAKLYQHQLVLTANLQHDIVELLGYLDFRDQAMEENIQNWCLEYLQNNPDTSLRQIIQSLGHKGLVDVGAGVPFGDGIALLIDRTLDLGIR
ncbi:hypothetical protein F4825DRAFT_456451 [Nemania diffusa]|nr:hypothetical protein F4825DRAFT_456451 [Nemania diffusa]